MVTRRNLQTGRATPPTSPQPHRRPLRTPTTSTQGATSGGSSSNSSRAGGGRTGPRARPAPPAAAQADAGPPRPPALRARRAMAPRQADPEQPRRVTFGLQEVRVFQLNLPLRDAHTYSQYQASHFGGFNICEANHSAGRFSASYGERWFRNGSCLWRIQYVRWLAGLPSPPANEWSCPPYPSFYLHTTTSIHPDLARDGVEFVPHPPPAPTRGDPRPIAGPSRGSGVNAENLFQAARSKRSGSQSPSPIPEAASHAPSSGGAPQPPPPPPPPAASSLIVIE